MKTNIILASAALSVMCCLYFVRLNDAAEQNASSSALVSASPAMAAAEFANPIEPTTAASIAPSSTARLRTTRNERTIATDSSATVKCKRGTKLFCPANSFVDDNGQAVTGEVRLVIEECYNLDEMLAAKLSTTSGDKRLETAGMIQVHAYSKGQEISLREGARYNIHFPVKESRKEDFQLFYGERDANGIIDWKLEPNSQPVSESSSSGSLLSDCFLQINASELRIGNRIREMDYFNWPLVNGQNLNQWFVSNFNPTSDMVDDFCARRMYSQITFKLNPDGSFQDYYVSHTAREDYDRIIASAISTMPALDMKKFMPQYTEDHACVLSFGRQQGRNTDNFKAHFQKKYTYKDSTQTMTDVATEDLSFYIFSSTQMGWINCDRFASNNGPLVDVTIRANMSETAFVSIVFEDSRSILSGRRTSEGFQFKGIPANKNVRVVAIDNPSGEPVMEVCKINTSCKSHTLRNPQPITLADLNSALQWN
ncbi:MAG: hypothetical protein ACKOSR_14335 [Flavobacteriales bacterium]